MLSVLVIAAKGLFFKFDWAWIRILKDISSSRGGVKVSGGKLFVLSARRTTKPVHCRIFFCLCALSFSHSIWWWCMWWDFIYVNGGTMIKYYQYCPDKPGAEVSKKKNYKSKKEFAYRMRGRRPTSAMPKPFLCFERAFCCSMVVVCCGVRSCDGHIIWCDMMACIVLCHVM